MRISIILSAVIFLSVLASCRNQSAVTEEAQSGPVDIVVLSDSQRRSAEIELGSLKPAVFHGTLRATGMLDVPPQNMNYISAPLGGFVKETPLLQGMRVNKGDLLVELQHPDYIQLQQDYLQSMTQLEFLQKDFARQQELAKENINAAKSLEQAKAQYESMLANVQGLEAKLSLLNITTETLKKHGIRPAVRLYSPMRAYVTEVNINPGKYVSSSDIMIKLVNTDHLHAELQIFEKDITRIAIGQPVTFQLANESAQRRATVFLIGREISPERTVRVHCHLEQEDTELLPGMFINASIQTAADTVNALPREAVVHYQGKSYVFVATENQNQFRLSEIEAGEEQNGMLVINSAEAVQPGALIVTKGAHVLLSLLFNTEDE